VSRESCSYDSAAATRTPAKNRVGLSCRKCDPSLNSEACECRWSRTWVQKALCNSSAASASGTRYVTADTRPGASHVVVPTSPGVLYLAAYYGTELSGKKLGLPLQSNRPGKSAAPKPQRAGPSAEQLHQGEGWNHVVRRGVSSRSPPLHP
jgi:hypothetical protein